MLLLDERYYSEGISLVGVRRIVFSNLSPRFVQPTWSSLQQRIARGVRLCSHHHLRESERRVDVTIYVSIAPNLPFKTLDEEKLDQLRESKASWDAAMKGVSDHAIDAHLYL